MGSIAPWTLFVLVASLTLTVGRLQLCCVGAVGQICGRTGRTERRLNDIMQDQDPKD
jgi:hypothetical protein